LPISKKYKNLFWGLLIIVFFVTFIFYKANQDYKSLDKNFITIDVYIKDVKIYKGVYFLRYSFLAKNKTLSGQTSLAVGNTNLTYLSSVFVGQKILLAVDSTNESNNILLLSRQDYKRFHTTPSDSILMIFSKIDSLRQTKFN
jgi:hypothetical protein